MYLWRKEGVEGGWGGGMWEKENGKRNCLNFRFDFRNMWQSWIKLEYYSVAYFECITEFELLLRVGLIYMHYVNIRISDTSMKCV